MAISWCYRCNSPIAFVTFTAFMSYYIAHLNRRILTGNELTVVGNHTLHKKSMLAAHLRKDAVISLHHQHCHGQWD